MSPDDERRGAGLAVAAGGLLMALGAFLPWATVESGFGELSVTGLENGDGIPVLILGAVVTLIGVARLAGADLPSVFARSPVAGAVVAFVLAVINHQNIQGIFDDATAFERRFLVPRIGAGLWTIYVGAGLALIGGLASNERSGVQVTRRECPFCKSTIRADATVCPHCQRESDPVEPPEPEPATFKKSRPVPPGFRRCSKCGYPNEAEEGWVFVCENCGAENGSG